MKPKNGKNIRSNMSNQNKFDIILFIIVFILFYISICDAGINAYTYKSTYDGYFQKYSKRFFSVGYEWHWFKSQGMAESNLDPNAESWVGAQGIMQIMPGTFDEIRSEINIPNTVYEPRWNIAGGIYYDKKLYNQWSAPRPEQDRRNFMFASYNAGLGNILKAQQECIKEVNKCKSCHDINTITKKLNCNLWNVIIQFRSYVNTWRHEETMGYVKRINKFMRNNDE